MPLCRPHARRIRPAMLFAAICLPFASLLPSAVHAEIPLRDLGSLGGPESMAHALSADGSVVVGRSDLNAPASHAFRWTAATGMVDLGVLPGANDSSARGVSANGQVVVGFSNPGGLFRAFRWTQAGGMINLGTLGGGNYSMANAVSADGSVVVGGASTEANQVHAFRWKNGVMSSLGTLGGSGSSAYGVSGDGSVVVGNSQLAGNSTTHAFRWTQAGMTDLGTLPGGNSSYANKVSADGTTIVGYGYINGNELRAFRWKDGLMSSLGSLGGDSEANGVSADGSVIVGKSGNAQNMVYKAFRWTAAGGMQSIEQWLTASGVQVSSSLATQLANAVSADGTVVVGQLANGHAFIARSSGLISPEEMQQSVGSTGTVVLGTAFLPTGTVVNGAHSRPLSRRVAEGRKTFWLTGDWGRDEHDSADGPFAIAEGGFGYNFGPAQVNLSVGRTWMHQGMDLGGRVKSDGAYVYGEALIPLGGRLWSTFGAFVHRAETDVRRGYLNAGLPDQSSGDPTVDVWGLRARLDWEDLLQLADARLSPYADLTYSRATVDAYSETGGGFPARFEQRRETATELRLGVNAEKPLADAVSLVGMLEAAHRFERHGARTQGEIIGLFDFDVEGHRNQRDWLHAAIGVQGRLAGGQASLMLHTTTQGETPAYWLGASWQRSF